MGAIAPSSPALCRQLASIVPVGSTSTVVELGPGTGVVSTEITRRLAPGSRHVAIELADVMVEHLRRTHPEVEVIQGDARDVRNLLADRGVQTVGAVVGGLPWALFPDPAQRAILDQVRELLAPGGRFTTFAYLHALPMRAARRFRELLGTTFDQVTVSRPVWANLPPALTYVARMSGSPGGTP